MFHLRHFAISVGLRIVLLVVTIFGMLWWYIKSDFSTAVLLLMLGVVLIEALLLYSYVTSVNKKLTLFLESVRYSDFTIKFRSDNTMGKTFSDLNFQFNEVLEAFRQARAEKEANLQYLNAIVQHIGTGLISFDGSGKINLINNAALTSLGIYRLRDLSELQEPHPQLFQLLTHLKTGLRELYRTPGGQPLAVQGTTIQLQGKWVRIVALQNIRPELQQQEVESWQNLTRVLRHEIMNSMTPIVSLVGTMRDIVAEEFESNTSPSDNISDLNEALQTLEKRSKGMMTFVNAYREFTTLPKPVMEVVSVEEVVKDAFHLLHNDLVAAGVEYETEVIPEGLQMKVDADQVQQVLINLIKNALEGFGSGVDRRISVRSWLLDDKIRTVIEVADNGNGIEPEALEKIFIPFYTTKRTGSGIGLSLSQQIIQQHGGQLTVNSQPGKGSVFRIII